MWQFETPPTENTGGRSVYIPQGKILGGSTSLNGLVYNRGQREDFDHWASLGNDGWSYSDVLPFFRKTETSDQSNSQYRGGSGPVRINGPEQHHPLCDSFVDAVAGLTGAPKHNDYNAESQFGTGYYQRFIHNGKRENIATRYLAPFESRDSVKVVKNALVERIRFDQGRATGVKYTSDGVTHNIDARCQVIVSAGTVNSAALLQRSGVGDGEFLQSLGIPLVHHLPGVGSNFQDHLFARLAFRLHDGVDSLNMQARGLRLGREVMRWMLKRPSILAWSPSVAYAFLNSEAVLNGNGSGSEARPDLQFVFSHGSYRPGRVYELDTFPAVTCGFTQQRPYSRGFVKISSPSVHDKPVVQPNYLMDDRDKKVAIDGVKIARQIMQYDSFASVFRQEQVPGADTQTDSELLSFVRDTGNTGYHLVGTCRMGPAGDADAVVGADLRVHGLDGLSVIDASIMPTVTSSNTCAASMMIGEKGADMIISGLAG